MTYKIRTSFGMALVSLGVGILKILDRLLAREGKRREPRYASNATIAAAVFAVFVIVAVGVMWWAFEQEAPTSCHPIQAQRVYTDGRNGATTQCL